MASIALHLPDELSDLPLVLLAPFPFDARLWGRVLDRLGGDAITVDPPGFAGVPAEGEPSLEAYADAVVDQLDAAGVHRFVVAGNSMGGYVAMAIAERQPARVAGIGLLGTKSAADADQARQNRLQMADSAQSGTPGADLVASMAEALVSDKTKHDDSEAMELVHMWLAEAPAEGIVWGQRAMAARPDRTEVLRGLQVPSLVLHGSADALMASETQKPMAKALGTKVITVDGRGHLLPLEAPDQTAAALRELTERVRAAS